MELFNLIEFGVKLVTKRPVMVVVPNSFLELYKTVADPQFKAIGRNFGELFLSVEVLVSHLMAWSGV